MGSRACFWGCQARLSDILAPSLSEHTDPSTPTPRAPPRSQALPQAWFSLCCSHCFYLSPASSFHNPNSPRLKANATFLSHWAFSKESSGRNASICWAPRIPPPLWQGIYSSRLLILAMQLASSRWHQELPESSPWNLARSPACNQCGTGFN